MMWRMEKTRIEMPRMTTTELDELADEVTSHLAKRGREGA
jgi:hypothetical protein